MVAHIAFTAVGRDMRRARMTDPLRNATSVQCMAQRCPRAGLEREDPLALG